LQRGCNGSSQAGGGGMRTRALPCSSSSTSRKCQSPTSNPHRRSSSCRQPSRTNSASVPHAVLLSLQVPGQFVGVRLTSQGTGPDNSQQLYSIACSPYESRRDSAYIGGSIIEVSAESWRLLDHNPQHAYTSWSCAAEEQTGLAAARSSRQRLRARLDRHQPSPFAPYQTSSHCYVGGRAAGGR
jgi:hypothetical protein